MKYLTWQEQKITDFSPEKVSAMYDRGFVFTRIGKGIMHQTRSCRIDLDKFSLTSENRRILKKGADISLSHDALPLSGYSWTIGKTAKDFYSTKFGEGIMSAQKIKEMLTDNVKSNFNALIGYSNDKGEKIGYAICYENDSIVHYSYPFYDLSKAQKDMGLIMMTKMIDKAKKDGKRYLYLGSLQRPTDTYKFQFEGLEWFNGEEWETNLEKVKKMLKNDKISM
jgi:arginyl-tRNA--protein-N-Asp/Glu arginylyltransferase